MSFLRMLSMASGDSSSGGDNNKKPPSIASTKPASRKPDPKLEQASSSSSFKNTAAGDISTMSEQDKLEQQQRIERLKADRLKSKQEAAAAKARNQPSKKTTSTTNTNKTKPSKSTSSKGKTKGKAEYLEPASSPPKKKLSFKEVMQQANNVNSDNLKMTVKVRKDNEQANNRKHTPVSRSSSTEGPGKHSPRPHPASSSRSLPGSESPAKAKSNSDYSRKPKQPASAPVKAAAAPASKPMDSLLEKQKRRRQRYEESDEEEYMDGFVVDDEEDEEASLGYNRDEIWKIFGRRRRDDYADDDDLSDMEATGSQVLEEENRSTAQGQLDDKLEEEELKRLAMEKARRKKAKRG